jgi:hypothetical protein
MRVVTNQRLIKRNKQFATYMFLFSMGVLVFGFFAANGQFFGLIDASAYDTSLYLVIMPVVLIVGFVCTMISIRMTNWWIRLPRPEQVIEESLRGVGNKAVLYNYFHLPARHVLISPFGVFAIVTRYQDGRFSVNGRQWRTHRTALGRLLSLFRYDHLGSPTQDAEAAAAHIQQVIDSIAPNTLVHPLIVFTDPRAQVNVEQTDIPILFVNGREKDVLINYLRSLPKDRHRINITPDQIAAFEQTTL